MGEKISDYKKDRFPVACRLCGRITWFSKDFYKPNDFKDGYECYMHEERKK